MPARREPRRPSRRSGERPFRVRRARPSSGLYHVVIICNPPIPSRTQSPIRCGPGAAVLAICDRISESHSVLVRAMQTSLPACGSFARNGKSRRQVANRGLSGCASDALVGRCRARRQRRHNQILRTRRMAAWRRSSSRRASVRLSLALSGSPAISTSVGSRERVGGFSPVGGGSS